MSMYYQDTLTNMFSIEGDRKNMTQEGFNNTKMTDAFNDSLAGDSNRDEGSVTRHSQNE